MNEEQEQMAIVFPVDRPALQVYALIEFLESDAFDGTATLNDILPYLYELKGDIKMWEINNGVE